MTEEQELKLDKNRKKFDKREEYFVRRSNVRTLSDSILSETLQKLSAQAEEEWERRGQRVYRNGVFVPQNLRQIRPSLRQSHPSSWHVGLLRAKFIFTPMPTCVAQSEATEPG